MKYTGRIITATLVFIINSSYISYYFVVNGHVEIIEKIGLPVIVSIAWWFGKQYDRAKFFSEKDPLTEVYNRRFVYKSFSKMVNKSKKGNSKINILLIDINNFKKINDTYGHEEGDAVLKAVSNTLLANQNKSEIIARWGGDEFVIVSPSDVYKDQAKIIEKIEFAVTKELGKCPEIKPDLGIAIGVAVYPDEARTLNELISIADSHMYKVKQKNQKPKTLI